MRQEASTTFLLLAGVYGASWPNFTWITTDNVVYRGNYQHWGTYQPGRRQEPNNMALSENCAGSNTTQGIMQPDKTTIVFDGLGGWADNLCSNKQIFICEIERGWLGTAPACCACMHGPCFTCMHGPCFTSRQSCCTAAGFPQASCCLQQ
jgi:hypothetical protein